MLQEKMPNHDFTIKGVFRRIQANLPSPFESVEREYDKASARIGTHPKETHPTTHTKERVVIAVAGIGTAVVAAFAGFPFQISLLLYTGGVVAVDASVLY